MNPLHAQQHGIDVPEGAGSVSSNPPWRIELLATVTRFQSNLFAWWSAPLGDLNQDGYDDFAVSSMEDTIFIYYGGDPFDSEPDILLASGGSGLASGDFNGDGRIDLAAAIQFQYGADHSPDPDHKGRVSIWFNTGAVPGFETEPDLTINGTKEAYLGVSPNESRSGLRTADFNGDGYDDLMTLCADTLGSGQIVPKMVVFYGGPNFDAVVDADLRFSYSGKNVLYVLDYLSGDLNGDGCCDVMIEGRYNDGNGLVVHFWDLFLGNRSGAFHQIPYYQFRRFHGWFPDHYTSVFHDVDLDGCDDLIDGAVRPYVGNAVFFHGVRDLPQVIAPNDSILNMDPGPMGDLGPRGACSVGDMNGDGSPDFLVSWISYFFPRANDYYMYPSGQYFKGARGYFGEDEGEFTVWGAYDAGDVNGDGLADVLTLGKATNLNWEKCRFKLHVGRRELSTGAGHAATPEVLKFDIHPNPVIADVGAVTLTIRSRTNGPMAITAYDILGRRCREERIDAVPGTFIHRLRLGDLVRGAYVLEIRQGVETHSRKLLVR